jgi:hypothetical protein
MTATQKDAIPKKLDRPLTYNADIQQFNYSKASAIITGTKSWQNYGLEVEPNDF